MINGWKTKNKEEKKLYIMQTITHITNKFTKNMEDRNSTRRNSC